MPTTSQQQTSLGLEDRDELTSHDVELVLFALFGGEIPLVAFPGELGNTCLRLAIRFDADELARGFLIER